jgi:hypothetical protein
MIPHHNPSPRDFKKPGERAFYGKSLFPQGWEDPESESILEEKKHLFVGEEP